MPKRRILLVYCLVALISALMLATTPRADRWDLYKNGRQTEGTVTQLTLEEHYTFQYKYVVAGIVHYGVGRYLSQRVGDRVPIWYLPGRPQISTSMEPKSYFTEGLIFVIVVVVLFPLLVTGFAVLRHNAASSTH